MPIITSLFKNGFARKEPLVAGLVAMLLLGAGVSHAAFYRFGNAGGFYYGYGFSSDAGQYGYGYGYNSDQIEFGDMDEDYGFLGKEGTATNISVTSVTRTSFQVNYSTDYLAKTRVEYGTTAEYGSGTSQSGFEQGTHSISVDGLACGTSYRFRVETTDVGNNVWRVSEPSFSVTTSPCSRSSSGGSSRGGFMVPTVSASIESLQALLADLLARYRALTGTDYGAPGLEVRDLTVGMQGEDVRALQTLLIARGYAIPAGATGFFAGQTQAALAAYQAANGIVPPAGYFGSITRAQMKAAGLAGLWW